MKSLSSKPYSWIPTLYFAEALPYTVVMVLSTIMYTNLDLTNTQIALYTGWLYLPWVIKPLWSSVVEDFGTKRAWVIAMQLLVGASFAAVALVLNASWWLRGSLAFLWLMAFSSATHDIAADGFYIIGLDEKQQALYAGFRSLFYRIGMIFCQGLIVVFIGALQQGYLLYPSLNTNLSEWAYGKIVAMQMLSIPRLSIIDSWMTGMLLLSVVFLGIGLWHCISLPRKEALIPFRLRSLGICLMRILVLAIVGCLCYFVICLLQSALIQLLAAALPFPGLRVLLLAISWVVPVTLLVALAVWAIRRYFLHYIPQEIVIFASKPHYLSALLFMLLFRFPEAQLAKMAQPFMLRPVAEGGLAMDTFDIGFIYGTIGVLALLVGGIIGGIVVSRHGLRRWWWPMVLAISLPDLVYVYFAYCQPSTLLPVYLGVAVEQLGYGFGFTAYSLFLVYYSRGERSTSVFSLCTGLQALGMMLPGMMAGWLADQLGFLMFFVWVAICCLVTFVVSAFAHIPAEESN